MNKERLGWIAFCASVVALACILLLQADSKIAELETSLTIEKQKRAADVSTATKEYNALFHEKVVLQQEQQDLKQIIADLTACNLSLDKQLAAAEKRPVTFTVYQETYSGSPIAKSPLALRFREEGILRTGTCGNFIFRARR